MDLGQGYAIVAGLAQQAEQLAVRVAAVQLVDVARLDPRAEQLEVLLDGAFDDIGVVRIPGEPDARMVGLAHHGGAMRRMGCASTMNFDPNLDVVVLGRSAAVA